MINVEGLPKQMIANEVDSSEEREGVAEDED